MNCPICGCHKSNKIISIMCGNFDKSTLYKKVRVRSCKSCGHVYNKLYNQEICRLKEYYNKEYAPINLSAKDITGDRPGSNNSLTIERYNQLFEFRRSL